MHVDERIRVEETALDFLLTAVRARRLEFSENQQVSADIVEAMKKAGLYRAMVARRFGGDEMPPADFLRLIETISEADGSAGWVASFGFSATYLSALPLSTLETMYAQGPDVVFAGGIYPPNIPVGVVVSTGRDTAIARPLADPSRLDFAMVQPIWHVPAVKLSKPVPQPRTP